MPRRGLDDGVSAHDSECDSELRAIDFRLSAVALPDSRRRLSLHEQWWRLALLWNGGNRAVWADEQGPAVGVGAYGIESSWRFPAGAEIGRAHV